MKTTYIIATAIMLTGCGPIASYRRPAAPVPAQWSESQQRGTSRGVEPVADLWWKSFHDPMLDSLIQRAVEANYDLQIAAARVEEARASLGFARSALSPQINAGASADRVRQSNVAPRFTYETNSFNVGGSLSWELDVFGRTRLGVQAAKADLASADDDRRAVLISLLADVARYYAELRGSQLRLEIASRNIAVAQDTLGLTKARTAAGLATARDVAQAEGQLESVRAQVPDLETSVQTSIHRLSVLLGKPPAQLQSELATRAPLPPVPPEIPTGVPSDLLERRPDIRHAEAQLIAATARVGQAKAEYYPRFTLLGSAGRQATQLHDLSLGLGNYFGAGPSVSLPVFTGGRIRSTVAIQDARLRESAATYQAVILRALEETENALTAYANEQERRDRLAAEVRSDETSFDLANVQYKAGLTDFLTVLDAQRVLFASQDQVARSETAVTTNLIGLYKALGGGWTISPNTP